MPSFFTSSEVQSKGVMFQRESKVPMCIFPGDLSWPLTVGLIKHRQEFHLSTKLCLFVQSTHTLIPSNPHNSQLQYMLLGREDSLPCPQRVHNSGTDNHKYHSNHHNKKHYTGEAESDQCRTETEMRDQRWLVLATALEEKLACMTLSTGWSESGNRTVTVRNTTDGYCPGRFKFWLSLWRPDNTCCTRLWVMQGQGFLPFQQNLPKLLHEHLALLPALLWALQETAFPSGNLIFSFSVILFQCRQPYAYQRKKGKQGEVGCPQTVVQPLPFVADSALPAFFSPLL